MYAHQMQDEFSQFCDAAIERDQDLSVAQRHEMELKACSSGKPRQGMLSKRNQKQKHRARAWQPSRRTVRRFLFPDLVSRHCKSLNRITGRVCNARWQNAHCLQRILRNEHACKDLWPPTISELIDAANEVLLLHGTTEIWNRSAISQLRT